MLAKESNSTGRMGTARDAQPGACSRTAGFAVRR